MDDQILQDLKDLGADAAMIAAARASMRPKDDDQEVFEDNVESVTVFQRMQTQWRISEAGLTGLDYAALPVVMRYAGVAPAARARVFGDVQIMERATLELIAEKA